VMSLTAINGSSSIDGTGGTVAALFVTALATGANYVLVRPTILLDPQTSDPAIFADGMVWYRSDTGQLYARINGATVALGGGGVTDPKRLMVPSLARFGAESAPGSTTGTTWPAANRAIYVPFELNQAQTLANVIIQVGTSSGNLDVGIYRLDQSKVVSKGSTPMGGTGVQTIPLSQALAAGFYILGINVDNTSAALFGATAPGVTTGGLLEQLGFRQQAVGAVTLPGPATFAVPTSAYFPLVVLEFV
jgi:hypothetical protein